MDDKALNGARSDNGTLLIVGYTESFGNGGADAIFISIDPDYEP